MTSRQDTLKDRSLEAHAEHWRTESRIIAPEATFAGVASIRLVRYGGAMSLGAYIAQRRVRLDEERALDEPFTPFHSDLL